MTYRDINTAYGLAVIRFREKKYQSMFNLVDMNRHLASYMGSGLVFPDNTTQGVGTVLVVYDSHITVIHDEHYKG